MRSNTHVKATSKFENQPSSPVSRMRGREEDCCAVFLSRIENRELKFLQFGTSPIESCSLRNSHVEAPAPQHEGIWRRGLWEMIRFRCGLGGGTPWWD